MNQPNKRDLDFICAYIKNDNLNIGECNATKSVVCEIDGRPLALILFF